MSAPIPVEGIFDRFKSIGDVLNLLRSGVVQEVLSAIAAGKAGDYAEVVNDLGDILALYSLPESASVKLLAAALKSNDRKAIVKAALGVLVVLADRVPEPVKDSPIRVGERKHISELTAAEATEWWEKNKSAVRTESQTQVAKFALRKLPELQAGIEGKLTADELMKLNPDEVTKWLNRAIIILTVASAVYPPLSVVVIALKLILARYESNNIDVGLSVTALAS